MNTDDCGLSFWRTVVELDTFILNSDILFKKNSNEQRTVLKNQYKILLSVVILNWLPIMEYRVDPNESYWKIRIEIKWLVVIDMHLIQ